MKPSNIPLFWFGNIQLKIRLLLAIILKSYSDVDMEHYVLCIWNGTFSEEDEILVTNYLGSLFPTVHQQQYAADFADNIATLLKPISKYIVVLNVTQESKDIGWVCLNDDFNVNNIFAKELNSTDCVEFLSKNVNEQLSVHLHTLADQLPAFGTYKLDVLIGSSVLKDLSVSKEPLLCNAFFRLVKWHCAYFSIFIQKEFDKDRIDEWCEIINADILHSNSKLELGAVLWRGDVQLQSSNNSENIFCQSFELKLDLVENEPKMFFHPIKEGVKETVLEHAVLSSKLQVVDEVSFTSIPPYMIAPVAFRLHLGKPNVLNETSLYFTDYLLSNKEVALIMRLGYAEINEKMKPERKYSTNRWQKTVASGLFRDPECFVSTFKQFITFAVSKSKVSDHIIAYPLRENISADFCFSIINNKSSSLCSQVSEERTNEVKESILSEIPFIRAAEFHKIMEKYTKQKMHLYNSGSSHNHMEDVSDLCVWEDIRNISDCSLPVKAKAADFLFEEIDPSDWPERILLLWKQMQNEKKCIPENAFLGQGLKFHQQSFSISNENISQYFLPSGEIKNLTDVEILNSHNNMDHLMTYDFDDVLQMKWPEVINCIFHDIYYNSSCQMEDKESVGSEMVKLYIQHETASSCSKQQITKNFSINVPEKNSSPYKEYRSPSCRSVNSVIQRHKKDCIAFNETSIKDLLTKKVLFPSKILDSQNSTNKERTENSITIPDKRTSKRKYSAPVRCSPRKKNPVNYKYPSVNKNTDTNKNSNDQKSKMPDLLRKKIRIAVATALGNNGINLKQDYRFYQSCGSRLFSICRAFVQDLPLKKGKTSDYLQKIADAHVKQVIEFQEKLLSHK